MSEATSRAREIATGQCRQPAQRGQASCCDTATVYESRADLYALAMRSSEQHRARDAARMRGRAGSRAGGVARAGRRRGDHRRARARQPAHRGVDGPLRRRRLDRRHAGDGHARHRARAAQHDRACSPTSTSGGSSTRPASASNIAVKDKFPWAPVPTGSWSANNKSFGLLFVHGNLFGRGKQLLIGGAHRHRRLGRGARLPRSVAVRQLDLLAAAGQRPAPEHPRVRPATTRAPTLGPVSASTLLMSYGDRAGDRHRLVPPGEDPGRLALRDSSTSTSRTCRATPTT